MTTKDKDEAFFLKQEFSGLYDDSIWECIECYLNLLETDHPENKPLSYAYIREKQQEDQNLLALVTKFPNNYIYLKLDDDVEDIVCYKKHPDQDDWKIALPEQMLPEVVQWFHQVLGHPGQTRMRDTLMQRYHHHRLRKTIDEYKCKECQCHKLAGKAMVCCPKGRYAYHLGKKLQLILLALGKSKSTAACVNSMH
jgi:hypothetical protein